MDIRIFLPGLLGHLSGDDLKMADWIWMLFGVVSGVGQGMGVLDGVEIVEWEEAVSGLHVGYSYSLQVNAFFLMAFD